MESRARRSQTEEHELLVAVGERSIAVLALAPEIGEPGACQRGSGQRPRPSTPQQLGEAPELTPEIPPVSRHEMILSA